jgi:CheY-like chemotaxis protein
VLPRTLPVPERGPEPGSNGPAEARPLVLIVEDHRPLHQLLVDWLSGAGLETVSAFDGRASVALARERRPQLIVLDMHLPGLDGWQVLHELKGDPTTADIPVVIVTISATVQSLRALPVEAFFVKPVESETFLARLRELGLVPSSS